MKISVVIPVYNKARFIQRSLDSVLAQTQSPLEILVIDDGSTDNSVEIITSYTDSRIRLLQQPNAGVSVARNRGIAEASGDWVAFLDADDHWNPLFLAAITEFLGRHPQLGAAFTNSMDGGSGKPTVDPALPSGEVNYFEFFARNNGATMNSSSAIIRRDVLTDIGGFPVGIRYGEDTDTWWRTAYVTSMGFLNQVLSTYEKDDLKSVSRNLAVGVQYPHALLTQKEWRAHDRIPAHLEASVSEATRFILTSYALHLPNANRNVEAIGILLRTPPSRSWWRLYVKAWISTLLPARLNHAIRTKRWK